MAALRLRRPALGPSGTLARVAVGIGLLYVALIWEDDPLWRVVALGLVAMPAAVVGGVLLWRRRSAAPIRATGALGHAANCVVIVGLVLLPATAGAAALFYGTSMLFAAVRGAGACELTAISNALLGRDDQVGCPLFAPLDALDRVRGAGACGRFADRTDPYQGGTL